MDKLAYENARFIPDANSYVERWDEEAYAWREREHAIGRARLNQTYGDHERQAFDLFYPAGKPAGLMVFVHGGYWHKFDRKSWSHFSRGATGMGWAVAMPSYRLAPEVRVADITENVRQALLAAAGMVAGPIVLAGHSAGGHLVARMACEDVGLPDEVRSRIRHIMPISPLSDLRPLIDQPLNEHVRIDEAEALAESPVLLDPANDTPVTVVVGSEERPAFLDQTRWLSEAWPAAQQHILPGRHHFDVIEFLGEAGHPLLKRLLSV